MFKFCVKSKIKPNVMVCKLCKLVFKEIWACFRFQKHVTKERKGTETGVRKDLKTIGWTITQLVRLTGSMTGYKMSISQQ